MRGREGGRGAEVRGAAAAQALGRSEPREGYAGSEPQEGSRVWTGRNPGPCALSSHRGAAHTTAEHAELPAWETYFFICPYDLGSYGM